jgi:uncharacterized protein YndB with AHSA1/START domain
MPVQRLQPLLLLMILALALACIALGPGLGLRSGPLVPWYGLALVLIVPGMALAIRGLSLAPKPGQPVDVRRFERQGSSILLALAFVIGAVALLVAAAVSPMVGLFIVGVAALWVLLWTPVWLRRVEIESSVLIQRDPAAVFSFVADAQNLPRYTPRVLSVEKITQGPVGPGTQFHSKMQVTPTTTSEAIAEIVDYEPNRRMTSRVTTGSTPNLDVITFTPADGSTLLSARFESEVSFNLALVGAAYRIPQARRQIMAAYQSSWIRLKQVLENTDADPPKP